MPSPGVSEALVPAWRAYVHLYLPFITSTLLYLILDNPLANRGLLLASAIPTYLLGSLAHSPRARPSGRFTRRSKLHQAAFIFAYGRLMRTPFNIVYYGVDLISSFALSVVLDRPESAAPRRSEFFVHALLAGVSGLVWGVIPPGWGLARAAMGAVDRAMWRAAWMALVDDVVKVLAYPDTGRKTGKVLVVGVQALLILFSVLWVFFMWTIGREGILNAMNAESESNEGPVGKV